MSRCRSLREQFTGALGVSVLLLTNSFLHPIGSNGLFPGLGGLRLKSRVRKLTPLRGKREATVWPLAALPGRTPAFDRASKSFQSRCLEIQEILYPFKWRRVCRILAEAETVCITSKRLPSENETTRPKIRRQYCRRESTRRLRSDTHKTL